MEVNDLITILVEQNKSFIEQNKNYKDLLFFGIGSIITILVIFLTANFFTMRKFRDEEKEKIKLSVYSQLEKENVPLLSQELNTKLEMLVVNKFESLEEKINTLTTELTNVKDYLSQFEQKNSTELSKTKQNFESKLSIINQKFDYELSQMKDTYNTELTTMQQNFNTELFEIKGNLYLSEAHRHFDKKVFPNAFTYYLKALEAFMDSNSYGKFGAALSGLEKSVSQLRNKHASDISAFTKISEKLDSEYQTQCQKIIDILLQVENY